MNFLHLLFIFFHVYVTRVFCYKMTGRVDDYIIMLHLTPFLRRPVVSHTDRGESYVSKLCHL